jgi:hypothetical protein
VFTCGTIDSDRLLGLWERALAAPAWARGDALLTDAQDGAARALGARNAQLFDLHGQLFGRELALLSQCPECASSVEFSVDCGALGAQLRTGVTGQTHRVEIDGHCVEFRLLCSADLAAASHAASDEDFAREVLERCVLACTHEGESVRVRDLPVSVLDTVSRRLEALDPAAAVSFDVTCPQCTARWDARLDVGATVWRKVQAAAERVLLDVHALARAYGWSESEVLRLSPTRRSAYLQMAAA